MSTTDGQDGLALVEAKDYAKALPKLNSALKASSSPAWLIARAKCHIAAQNYTSALHDAEAAYLSASNRGSRPLMTDAQYRRAVALFRLGQTTDADVCAHWTMKLAEGVPMRDPSLKDPAGETDGFWRPDREALLAQIKSVTAPVSQGDMTSKKYGSIWNTAGALRLQIIPQIDKFGPDDEKRRITVPFVPVERKKDEEEDELVKEAVAEKKAAEAAAKAEKPKEARVDFFQSNTTMTASVFAKGVPKDAFKAEITADTVRLSHIPGYEPWYEIALWGRIDPAQSKYTVTPNKVELSLRKAEAVKWPTLRGDTNAASAALAPAAAAPISQPAAPAAPAEAKPTTTSPSYPTSSRTGAKNWDKVLQEENVDEKESVNDFFKHLYKDATDDQRRAMMKSFTESNGTSLSTNWADVKDGKVETVPPEGVVPKKWDS